MPTIDAEVTNDPAVAFARQALYRFAALALLDPKCGGWEQLDVLRDDVLLRDAADLVRDLPEAVADELALGERPLADLDPSAVFARLPHSAREFNQHFENTFGLLVSNACPPYETEYIPSKFTFQRSHGLADISGFYRAFGLTTSHEHPERPDHIVQELEFMAFLIGLARQADADETSLRVEQLEVCWDAQDRFLSEHLAWWAPAFAMLLEREDEGEFYAAVAVFLSAFIAAERSLFQIPPATKQPTPDTVERPEACKGCQLA